MSSDGENEGQQQNTAASMAHSIPIRPMPEFNPDTALGASVATRWKNWISDFDMFLVASGITDTKRQRHYSYTKPLPECEKFLNSFLKRARTKTMTSPQLQAGAQEPIFLPLIGGM